MDGFNIELKGVKEALAMLDPNIVVSAARQALNRVAGSAKTEASRLIRQDYNVKANRLAQFLTLTTKATSNSVQAVITGKGLGMALGYFDPKQSGKFILYSGKGKQRRGHLGSKYGRGYAGDVSVLVRKSGGRKVISSDKGNKPFIAQMPSGHIGIFVRTGKGRSPIKQLIGPGAGGLFGSRRIMTQITDKVNREFKPEFDRLIDLKMKGLMK